MKNQFANVVTGVAVALALMGNAWAAGEKNGCHYLGCANNFALMGKAFAEALNGME